MRKIAVALLLGSLAFSPRIAVAEDEDLDQAIKSADTPAKHEAIAKQYHEKAEAARAEVALHEKMASSYALGPVKMTQVAQAQQHCRKIAANEKSIASEYDALAKLHEAAAKKP